MPRFPIRAPFSQTISSGIGMWFVSPAWISATSSPALAAHVGDPVPVDELVQVVARLGVVNGGEEGEHVHGDPELEEREEPGGPRLFSTRADSRK